jgi:hypothetical protein
VVRAQTTETPIPFDSAGSVRALTQGLAERLMLTSPAWPVTGAFDEARLYAVSGGEYVLVVQLAGGVVRRYPLSAAAREALGRAITDALARTGRVVGEERTASISEPARGAFIRNQMLLTALVYAPAGATLTHDGKAGAAVWLLATGGSYFALSSLAKRTTITKAQNHLATDGGLRGALLTDGLLHTFGVDMDADIAIGAGLAGALAGAVTGFKLGKRWTDGEASATTNASTLAALTALGVAGVSGIIDDSTRERLLSGVTAASGVAGYMLGRQYPRRAGYRVTSGDIGTLQLTALLGIGVSAIPFVRNTDVDERAFAGALTAGMLGGVLVGDLVLVRRFDHTEGEAWRVKLGALAGGLLGGAVVVLAEPSASGGVALVTAGAIVGTFLGERVVSPARDGSRRAEVPATGSARGFASRVSVDPTGLVAAFAGVRGSFPVAQIRF